MKEEEDTDLLDAVLGDYPRDLSNLSRWSKSEGW